jgi:alginate O-acetyltransferase complex protein AlgI
MIFSEPRFLYFFALVFVVSFSLRSNRWRKAWLLVCSYAFYANWDWRFLSLLLISTGVDFVVGARLGRVSEPRTRKLLLTASLTANLGILAVFKYMDFFIESAARFSAWLGLPVSVSTLGLVLPMGISFYTFQTLSYTIDVYRNQMRPVRSLLDFALFVSFFPQLVAGPIVRAREFLPQLARAPKLTEIEFRRFLVLFLIGFVKKACIADRVAQVADPVFANPSAFGASSQWLASVLYSTQIYCDFSGYTDMAIAATGLLGYRLTLNFDFPYLARSIRDFWRRWHISLSTWFRDYLYIPMGGSRAGSGRTGLNLVIVFLLCGLWHGASWNFILWGAFHGTFLALERRVPADRLPPAIGWLYTLLVVNTAFVIFRAQDLGTAAQLLSGMFGVTGSTVSSAHALASGWWLLLAGLLVIHAIQRHRGLFERIQRVPSWGFAAGYGTAVALALPWVVTRYTPFIYFQF